jgi:DNA-directed RNA polymerase subunit beta
VDIEKVAGDITQILVTEEQITAKVKEIKVIYTDNLSYGSFVRDTLLIDKINTPEEALVDIYKRMRPGDPPTLDASRALFENLFFNTDRYDLSLVGRLKLNYKFPVEKYKRIESQRPETFELPKGVKVRSTVFPKD